MKKKYIYVKKFKTDAIEKIYYLKNEDEFIGYYWSQKIY